MGFDYYTELGSVAESKNGQTGKYAEQVNEAGLASGFVDKCTVWYYKYEEEKRKQEARKRCIRKQANTNDGSKLAKRKQDPRKRYIDKVKEPGQSYKLPGELCFEPDHTFLPDPDWFGLEVSFILKSPWYSKDDRLFHVLDNPVRKDRVFGVPFMSASSWKGLLRWACRMRVGLLEHLKSHNMKMDDWKDPPWIIHLFGNERGEEVNFQSGALVFYPTWFDKVGFEVINPHKRASRAGTNPIHYEVVPAGTKGKLRLLYAPLPGGIELDNVKPAEFIVDLIYSIKELLEKYGISAKRTSGWGTAKIDLSSSKLWCVEDDCLKGLTGEITTHQYDPPKEAFRNLMNEEGNPRRELLDESGNLLSKTQFKKLPGEKPCTSNEFEEFKRAHGEQHRMHLKTEDKDTSLPRTVGISLDKVMDALKRREDARREGNQ